MKTKIIILLIILIIPLTFVGNSLKIVCAISQNQNLDDPLVPFEEEIVDELLSKDTGVSLDNSINFSDDMLEIQNEKQEFIFLVYDEEDNLLFEGINVSIGDIFIDKKFNKYEIYLIDENLGYARARFIESLKKPNITKKYVDQISGKNSKISKKIALYLTHNDESYLIGDGYDSIYGAGGIHDIARELKTSMEKKGIEVVLDETMHIPHNSSAYTRSAVTANKLINNEKPNALFDIHRDGVRRSVYSTEYGGKERCMVKIVVGQANPNKDVNLQFALYLMSVAEIICPWLFTEIYFASGHYNQALSSKNLLFEMGTYTIEKSMVLETVPYLAEVINTTLFSTVVDDDGNLTIEKNPSPDKLVDSQLDNQTKDNSVGTVMIILVSVISAGVLGYFIYYYFYRVKKVKNG